MESTHGTLDSIIGRMIGNFLDLATMILREHWPVLLVLTVLAIFGRILRSTFVKGRLGEAAVAAGALRNLKKDGYRVFNDLVLARRDGRGTTQIDHVIASHHGIFVVETKNYDGWIFGDVESRYWTQILRGKKSRFQNPLHQNAMHINALAAVTGIPKDRFRNVVYFVGGAVLKTELPPHILTRDLAEYIRSHRDNVVSDAELDALVDQLESNQSNRTEARRAHRRQMTDKYRE
jgi:hypothetical protein